MAPAGCVDFFETLGQRMDEVNAALSEKVSKCGTPVYTSLDVRDAGWKICVVDVNLFPAGFNVLSEADRERGANQMREFFSARLGGPGPFRITVVPEAHTNNAGYLENLAGIIELLKRADCQVKLLWPGDPIPKPWIIKTTSGTELEYLPAAQALEGAQALLLNHDLSGGIPKIIEGISLPTFPSVRLGWYRRRKSKHFEIAESLLRHIARKVDFFDPWYFSMRSATISEVDFDSDAGLQKIATEAEQLFAMLKNDYRERGISDTPHLFIKNDAGTYGMGVVSVHDPAQILDANRSLRKKMRKGKESVPISQVILQEGVPTALTYEKDGRNIAAEPTIYMVNGTPIGGFYRIHENLGDNARFENLNQPGGKLEPFDTAARHPFPLPRNMKCNQQLGPKHPYGFLARLHAIAAGLEECAP